jgi:hypothetical protein
MVTREFLQKRYCYEPSGFFRNRKTGNVVAGYVQKRHGYRVFAIRINGKIHLFKYHRLIFLYHHGFLPSELDHANRDKLDNKIENLRASDRVKNNANRDSFRDLPKGVYARGTRFMAMITIAKRNIYLGQFKTVKEAADAFSAKHRATYGNLYD